MGSDILDNVYKFLMSMTDNTNCNKKGAVLNIAAIEVSNGYTHRALSMLIKEYGLDVDWLNELIYELDEYTGDLARENKGRRNMKEEIKDGECPTCHNNALKLGGSLLREIDARDAEIALLKEQQIELRTIIEDHRHTISCLKKQISDSDKKLMAMVETDYQIKTLTKQLTLFRELNERAIEHLWEIDCERCSHVSEDGTCNKPKNGYCETEYILKLYEDALGKNEDKEKTKEKS